MNKYTSNNYFLLDYVAYLVFLLLIIGVFIFFLPENQSFLMYASAIGIVIIAISFLIIKRLAKINFMDNHISVNYFLSKSENRIDYKDIITYQHISVYGGTSRNLITYHPSGRLKITSVLSDKDFSQFHTWIQGKNKNIRFEFYPVDSKVKRECNQ